MLAAKVSPRKLRNPPKKHVPSTLNYNAYQMEKHYEKIQLAEEKKGNKMKVREEKTAEQFEKCVLNNLAIMNDAIGTQMVRTVPNTDLLKSYILPQNKAIQAVIDAGLKIKL